MSVEDRVLKLLKETNKPYNVQASNFKFHPIISTAKQRVQPPYLLIN